MASLKKEIMTVKQVAAWIDAEIESNDRLMQASDELGNMVKGSYFLGRACAFTKIKRMFLSIDTNSLDMVKVVEATLMWEPLVDANRVILWRSRLPSIYGECLLTSRQFIETII